MFRSLVLVSLVCCTLTASGARALTTEALLDTLQHTAFDYFWNEANPTNGLIKDRSTLTSPCSIASLGLRLSAICIGIDHGWVSRTDGGNRVLTGLETLEDETPRTPEHRFRLYAVTDDGALTLVATCPSEEAVGVAICTLGREGHWGRSCIGLLDTHGTQFDDQRADVEGLSQLDASVQRDRNRSDADRDKA